MRLRWSKEAAADRDEIYDYLAGKNPSAALKVDALIWESAVLLTKFPYLGRAGRVQGTREYPIPNTPYIIAYRIQGEALRILIVRNGYRRWPTTMPKL